MKINLIALGCLLLSSCASIHPGTKNQSQDGKFIVSLEKEDTYSDDYHHFYNVTIENLDTKWARVKSVEVDFDQEGEEPANILVGEDLDTWAKALIAKKKVEGHNEAMLLAGLMTGSVVLGALSGSDGTRAAAATTYAGSTAYVAGKGISASVDDAESANKIPEEYIYRPFAVPAKMFARKWLVLNVKEPKGPQKIAFTLTMVDGSKYRFLFLK